MAENNVWGWFRFIHYLIGWTQTGCESKPLHVPSFALDFGAP